MFFLQFLFLTCPLWGGGGRGGRERTPDKKKNKRGRLGGQGQETGCNQNKDR